MEGDLFQALKPVPEDGCFTESRYAACDLCDVKEAPGLLYHHMGVPVLFICEDCGKKHGG